MKKPASNGESLAPILSDGITDDSASHASPYKSAAEELDRLRKVLREVSHQFVARMDTDIILLRERVVAAGEEHGQADAKPKAGNRKHAGPNVQLYDLRDMTTLMRTLDVKAPAGRRKDLKKIESLVEELQLVVERWK